MKTLLLYIIVYSVVYIASVALIVGIMGVINLCRRKPFLDRWRHNLFDVSFMLIVMLLADLIPPRLRFTVVLPAGLLLFSVAFGVRIWVRIKYPNHSSQQRTVVWKRGKSGGAER